MRRCVDEPIRRGSLFKLMKIFAPAWRFLLMTTILLGVGLGLSEWSFFAEQKHVLLNLIIPTAIFDAIKFFKDGIKWSRGFGRLHSTTFSP